MPLKTTAPPREVTDRIRTTLRSRVERTGFRLPALLGASKRDLALGAPHPVYLLTLDDLTEGRGLDAARPAGWRYLVHRDGRFIAAAELPPGGTATDLVVNEGPFVAATAAAIEAAERLPEVDAADFEARLLKIPALYTVALWLRSPDGADDLVVPVGDAHPALESGRAYRADAFVEALIGPAREQRAFDTSPRG